MSTAYRCGNAKRRESILNPPSGAVLNGIDYLEVIDTVPVAGMPRQRTLLVRLFRDAPTTLTPSNVRITGGVRVRTVAASWIARADAVTAPGVSAAEAAHYAALANATLVLVIRTDVEGDFADYELALVAGSGSDEPPAGFDPVLARVTFGFKVECPTDFDCATTSVCAPELGADPAIDYLAKDYQSFRRALLDRLSVIAPAWRDRSPADPLMTVLEVMAYAADHLSYQQDAVATEAYLGTARRRVSVRRHARLLDYRMHEGACARTWLVLEVNGPLTLTPDNARFLAARASTPMLSADAAAALPSRPIAFVPVHTRTAFSGNNLLAFYTWGDDACCLPRGATSATIAVDTSDLPVLAAGDVLVLEERLGPPTWTEADADPARRHAVRLTAVTPRTDPFSGQPVLDVQWHLEDALPFPLCISAADDSGTAIPNVAVARGNVVLVEHGEWAPLEELEGDPDARRYRPRLARADLSHAVPYVEATARTRGARSALRVDARRAVPMITLEGPDGPWTARRDLLGSAPTANDFVVELDDDGLAHLRFGDGRLGRKPIADLTARYRIGRGTAGNVGRESIRVAVVTGIASGSNPITAVRNPIAATGGVDPEPVREVKLFAPQAFRKNERAVSEADYAAWAEEYPDVQRAVAVRRWTGSWNTILVVVDRMGGRTMDGAFREGLRAHLERYRLAGFDLELADPVYVPLDIHLVVCVKPGFFRADVNRGLLDTFTSGDRRDGTRGFFHPDRFSFGQPLHLSALIAAAMAVPGVEWVDTRDARVRFQRFGRASAGELTNQAITMGTVEIVRLDNSPSLPENGRIGFDFDGGR